MSTLRVTGGNLRGRVLHSPEVTGTHPMGARERLALFNMLADRVTGARVLDAYAGTGALGIEALSRGAREVVFVEKSPRVAAVIRRNLADLGLTELGKVITRRVGEVGAELGEFEVILADPPYELFGQMEREVVAEVAKLGQLLAPEGVLVLSHPDAAPELAELELVRTRKYAGARISTYHRGDFLKNG